MVYIANRNDAYFEEHGAHGDVVTGEVTQVPAHKLTRKELKKDSFVDLTGRGVEFLQEHYLKLGIAILAVVVVILGISIYNQGQARAKESASYLLYQGQSLLNRGAYVPAQERLQECIDRFGGTEAGKQARLDLAHVLMALGENEAALATIREGLSAVSAEDPLYRELEKFRAAALMNLSQFSEAGVIYRDMLAQEPSDQERYEISMRYVDCLKMEQRYQEGIELLEALKTDVENGLISVPTRDLESRLQLLRALSH
jgi:predicted negative regulator of RcsB-dependent stress response